MNAVLLATFSDKEPAESLKNRLESAGVHAVVHDLRTWQRWLLIRDHLAGVVVEVDRQNYENSKTLMQDWDAKERILSEAIACPDCGSPRVEYPQYGRKFVSPALHLGLGIALGVIKKEFYCTDCQMTWPREVKVERDRDALGWPTK